MTEVKNERKHLTQKKSRNLQNIMNYRLDEISNGDNILLDNNRAINTDGFGFRIKGFKCSKTSLKCTPDSLAPTTTNYVLGALHGVAIWENSQQDCSRISGFIISKCVDYGIYAQLKSSLTPFFRRVQTSVQNLTT